jgi:asparagine synthase (glutamine-hydrolysing)
MCGIAGFVSKQYKEENLKSMTNALRHRGPDAEGFYFDENIGIALGHRRLSILDLSENGNQPFFSKDKRFITIYNGEVYNYRETALKYAINPQTSTDTEVIVERFAKDGEKSIADFNGMFALAIWDTIAEKLYLIRDRVGIKPLYYYFDGENFAFASEIKGLVQLPIDKSLDYTAIANYLYLGFFPQEQSIFKHIKKLPAGCIGTLEKNSFSIKSYWTLESGISQKSLKNEQEAKKQLKELLIASVQGQMISDVPLGTFLSGGIDSSLVTAIAQHISTQPIKTFSIGFKEAKFNEANYARSVAQYLKTDHHEFILSKDDALDKIQDLLDVYDEPLNDGSAVATLLVSEMARKHVTVTLSGDGGDELFLGYNTHTWAKRLDNPIVKTIKYPLSIALKLTGNKRLQNASEVLNYTNSARIKSHVFSQYQYLFSEKALNNLLLENEGVDFEENTPKTQRALSKKEGQAFFDFSHYLKDGLLVKVDRASMFYGLETRVPLLDHNIVEFAFNLDESLKYKSGEAKYLLKQVLYDFIPASYFNRPKQGFSIPLEYWLKTDLRYLIEEYLSEESVRAINICRYDAVKSLKEAYLNGNNYDFKRLWGLILLHKWLHENTGRVLFREHSF